MRVHGERRRGSGVSSSAEEASRWYFRRGASTSAGPALGPDRTRRRRRRRRCRRRRRRRLRSGRTVEPRAFPRRSRVRARLPAAPPDHHTTPSLTHAAVNGRTPLLRHVSEDARLLGLEVHQHEAPRAGGQDVRAALARAHTRRRPCARTRPERDAARAGSRTPRRSAVSVVFVSARRVFVRVRPPRPRGPQAPSAHVKTRDAALSPSPRSAARAGAGVASAYCKARACAREALGARAAFDSPSIRLSLARAGAVAKIRRPPPVHATRSTPSAVRGSSRPSSSVAVARGFPASSSPLAPTSSVHISRQPPGDHTARPARACPTAIAAPSGDQRASATLPKRPGETPQSRRRSARRKTG